MVRRETKGLADTLATTRAMLDEERLVRAVDRAREAVGDKPDLLPYLDHPDFAAAFIGTLRGQDRRIWDDPASLRRVVALLSVDLDEARLPRPGSGPGGRPSPSAGRAPRGEPGEEDIRSAARYLGRPAAELRAARHTSIEDWRRERAQAKGRERRR